MAKHLKQQAAIAVAMKKAGKKPKSISKKPLRKYQGIDGGSGIKSTKRMAPKSSIPKPTRPITIEEKYGILGNYGPKTESDTEMLNFIENAGQPKIPSIRTTPPVPKKPTRTPMYNKGGNWIQGAIKKPGALRESLGVKKGEKIPASKLKAAAKKGGKLGQRARLAITLKKLRSK